MAKIILKNAFTRVRCFAKLNFSYNVNKIIPKIKCAAWQHATKKPTPIPPCSPWFCPLDTYRSGPIKSFRTITNPERISKKIMSMIPFFPSLMPPTTNSLWFDIDVACDEDSEITNLENDHQQWLNSISQTASDLNPLGKTPAEHIDNETDEEDQDANDDDSAESESHDEEEEDDEIEPNGLIIDGSDPRNDYDNPMPMLTNND